MATPLEKYKLITGRYAFSAANKHLMAEMKSPSVAVGVELVYIYNNLSNFDLKLKAHASITYVNSLLIVGKRDVDTVSN